MFIFENINKINSVNNINRAQKLKNFLLIINFNKDLRVDYLEINIKLTRNDNIYLLL